MSRRNTLIRQGMVGKLPMNVAIKIVFLPLVVTLIILGIASFQFQRRLHSRQERETEGFLPDSAVPRDAWIFQFSQHPNAANLKALDPHHRIVETKNRHTDLQSRRDLTGIMETGQKDTLQTVIKETCRNDEKKKKRDWKWLCNAKIVETALSLLRTGHDLVILQVGAHTGFESNDPIATGIEQLIASTSKHVDYTARDKFNWFFIEASPPNFAKLQETIKKHSDTCNMHAIHAAIVSEEQKGQDLTFYSISDTIDPETG